jgi:predicted regulator of Ras-like GTPase activity (Roadblock/LC7/MglB family)
MALFGETPAPPSRLEELRRILQRDPTSRQFLALAEEYRRQGRMRDTIVTLERGLSVHTTAVAAHVALGKAYQQLERWEDAIRAYQNALKNDRENLVAIRQIAEVYLSRGDKLEALKKLKLYRGLKPGEREVQETIERLERELEPPPPERFPSGVRALHADLAARGAPSPRAPSLRDFAVSPESAAPFDLPSEPGGSSPGTERPPETVWLPPVSPPPAEAPPAAAFGPAAEEVFPPGEVPAAGEPDLSDVPTRVSSVPETAAFLETELVPPPEETVAGPAEPFEAAAPSATPPPEPPPEAVAPAAPPAYFDSGLRRGLPHRERYEAPAPIEMTREEVATAPEEIGPARFPPSPAPEADVAPRAATPPDDDGSESPTGPLVTETLAELYRSQGYLSEAREVYLALAASATDPEASRAYARKAEALRITRQNEAIRKRLESLLTPFPPPAPLATEDLSALLRSLVAEVPGLRAAALTDREGLAVVTEGLRSNGESLEVLIAELTSFVKNVGRSGAEIGGGPLRSLAVVGEKGAAILANVTPDYALVLEAEPEAALGEVRWAAARAAERLRPAVG